MGIKVEFEVDEALEDADDTGECVNSLLEGEEGFSEEDAALQAVCVLSSSAFWRAAFSSSEENGGGGTRLADF